MYSGSGEFRLSNSSVLEYFGFRVLPFQACFVSMDSVVLCAVDQLAFLTTSEFHLQGCVFDLKLVVQELADFIG